MAYRLRLHDHIDEVDPAEWDALLDPEDLQASHRFVLACQQSGIEAARYRHAVLHDAQGVVGIASFCVFRVALDALATGVMRSALGWARRLRPGLLRLPVVFCGLPVSFGRSCLRLADRADRGAALRLLAETAEDFAADHRASVVCFKEFTDEEAADLAALGEHGYFRAPSLPSCFLDLPWTSFPDYLAHLRAGYRRQVRQTLAARQACRLSVRQVTDLGPECPRLFDLYGKVIDRAPFRLETLNPAFFGALARGFPSQVSAVLVEQHETLLAHAILLRGPTRTTFLLAGIEYGPHRSVQAYPNVVLEVVRNALAAGSSGLEMGQTSYPLKTRLGARATNRHVFIRHRSRWQHRVLTWARDGLFPSTPLSARRVFRTEISPRTCSPGRGW